MTQEQLSNFMGVSQKTYNDMAINFMSNVLRDLCTQYGNRTSLYHQYFTKCCLELPRPIYPNEYESWAMSAKFQDKDEISIMTHPTTYDYWTIIENGKIGRTFSFLSEFAIFMTNVPATHFTLYTVLPNSYYPHTENIDRKISSIIKKGKIDEILNKPQYTTVEHIIRKNEK